MMNKESIDSIHLVPYIHHVLHFITLMNANSIDPCPLLAINTYYCSIRSPIPRQLAIATKIPPTPSV